MSDYVAQQNEKYELELLKNPYHLKLWLNYLAYNQENDEIFRYKLYERALVHLPRSYKLWHTYLKERTSAVNDKSVLDKRLELLIDCYERALVHLNKMPRIWLDYIDLMMSMLKGTETRKIFDRALQSLPVTQHKNIWSLYIGWVKDFGVPETAIKVYRRYLMYDPAYREEYIEYLESIDQYTEAAKQLAICIDDHNYVSPKGTTRHQQWMKLCDICASHPTAVCNLFKVEEIIRSGIQRYTDEVGKLWCRLADYYIRLGQFERARDVFEEAINTVKTVKDFSIIFDAYMKVEESVVTTKIRLMEEEEGVDVMNSTELSTDMELALARLEYLMEQRPLLLNSVKLRQNPNNIMEWHTRIKLYKGNQNKINLTYHEAFRQVDPAMAHGKLSSLYLGYAKYYEKTKKYDKVREIFQAGVAVDYKNVDELVHVYCRYCEFELRMLNYDDALSIAQQATTQRRKAIITDEKTATSSLDKVFKQVRIWNLYLDLEASLGTLETCKAAYERAIELKVITPGMLLNYALYMEEHNFYEESFRIYEKGISIFVYPPLRIIWLTYIDKFIARYEGTKIERLRDIFENAVKEVTTEYAAEFYIKYAKAEEQYGLARHAIAIFDRGCKVVADSVKLDFYKLYIKKVEQHYGVTKTRPIYEKAIQVLSDDMCRLLCLDFAEMETKIGEVDRARAIYAHGSQFADPKRELNYYVKWQEFEEEYGNEDTYREMLRIKRTMELANSQVNYMANDFVAASVTSSAVPIQGSIDQLASQAELEAIEKANSVHFVSSKRKIDDDEISNKREKRSHNDEINIDP